MSLSIFLLFTIISNLVSCDYIQISYNSTNLNVKKIAKRDASQVAVCIYGFSISSNGLTVCNQDASGQSRQANEV